MIDKHSNRRQDDALELRFNGVKSESLWSRVKLWLIIRLGGEWKVQQVPLVFRSSPSLASLLCPFVWRCLKGESLS